MQMVRLVSLGESFSPMLLDFGSAIRLLIDAGRHRTHFLIFFFLMRRFGAGTSFGEQGKELRESCR